MIKRFKEVAKGTNEMKKRPLSRNDVPWSKRQRIPDPQVLDAAEQYEEACNLLKSPPSGGVLFPLMNTAAIAVELYLKCLSAELIYIEDELMPEVSRVYAAPAIMSGQGHRLVALLNVIPADVRESLINTFDAELGARWNKGLECMLANLEGAFMASRYAFEHGIDITRYKLEHLLQLVDFLGRFARSVQPMDLIEWK
jgi:hypothetical protein